MALLERFAHQERRGPNLNGLIFVDVLAEWEEGNVGITRQQIIDVWELDASDIADLDWLISKYQASTNKPYFREVLKRIFLLAQDTRPTEELDPTFGYKDRTQVVARIVGLP